MTKYILFNSFRIIIITTITLGFSSCNNEAAKNKEEFGTSTVSIKSIEKEAKNPFVGAWEEPIPGQENKFQGFILNKDGSAESINMATLKYKSWKVDSNNIIFIAESIGNHISFIDTISYTIKSINENTLILKDENQYLNFKKTH
jgi:hypothetical protein